MMKKIALIAAVCALIFTMSCQELEEMVRQTTVKPGSGLSEDTIIAGLKEALEIGTSNAVDLVSRSNGYLNNAAIVIPIPSELDEWEDRLRAIGLGRKVDEFKESMNHAAEQAAEKAVSIFVDAIKQMTFADARRILNGPPDAATRYFEDKTRGRLYGEFFPVVRNAMDRVGVTQLYKFLVDKYNAIPLIDDVRFDLDQYVTDRALDGLFYMVEQEEAQIRKDPAARVTELLKKVFG
jgi:hypothetical protein